MWMFLFVMIVSASSIAMHLKNETAKEGIEFELMEFKKTGSTRKF